VNGEWLMGTSFYCHHDEGWISSFWKRKSWVV